MDFPFAFSQKSSLLLIFFFHGIIFSLLLLRKGIIHNNKASRWLSLLLFLYAMYITPYMLGYANWYAEKITKEILFFIPFMQVLLIGPVVYFYTKSLLNTSFKLIQKDWLHFVPALLYLIYSLIVFVIDKIVLDDYYFYADDRDKDLANWYQATGLISMTLYLALSLRYYFNYKKLVFDKVSYAETLLFKWIRNFMVAFLGILILRVLFFILNPDWGEFGSQFWHYISFSFVFYYIAVTGYGNIIKQITLSGEKLKIINVFENEILAPKNTHKTIDTEQNVLLWKDKLSKLMIERRLFENPRLTLADVANELETTTKTISSVVNSGFKMNFNDFVNYYRIQAIKEKLDKGEQNSSTLLGIALDCGFNSKATFNRAFKKSTSLTPKDYLEKIRKE
ncbi:helix-turn-helix domain-containing protein [Aquimarina sp. 2201CG14-23]|uniref:helix-turn-helix domain-containing protein n=1 Tax=Aquimarina mycalae TaxID=3040073 RepID=UPI002477CF62|nr:AraC family transcriptional regulator [Aquimarina sp. 2201CG14-23]MDH7447909.1 AraC family transcriptional regulator [Aquimarina sp. 2201CG14-23]